MKKLAHQEFLITKYVLFFKRYKIPPIYSSIIFGVCFNVPALVLSIFRIIPVSFGYFSCLFWLFIGPFLIYTAGQMVDELWPKLSGLFEIKTVNELKVYEKRFHGRGYLIVGIPAVIAVSILVLAPQGLLSSSISVFTLFYLFSWIILAILGSIGIWGTIQLISMIWRIRKYDATLNPYSPDGFGGMGILANFAVKATVMYSTGALMIPMTYDVATRNDTLHQAFYGGLFASVFFSITVMLSFLVQIVALNRAAAKGKNKLLEETGQQCVICARDCQDESNPNRGIQMLVAQSFYNQVNQMRVYPFDLGIIMKLAGSLALPILLGTIRIWLPWLPLLD